MPPRGVSTPKSRAASRANGARGAAHGKKGGRPRSAMTAEDLEAIGAAPIGKPLKLMRWYANLIAVLTQRLMEGAKGKGIATLLNQARASAATSSKILPYDVIIAAAAVVKDDEDDQKEDAGGAVVEREVTGEPRRARAIRRGT